MAETTSLPTRSEPKPKTRPRRAAPEPVAREVVVPEVVVETEAAFSAPDASAGAPPDARYLLRGRAPGTRVKSIKKGRRGWVVQYVQRADTDNQRL